jgi:two-component system, NtrC family, response regulator HydG
MNEHATSAGRIYIVEDDRVQAMLLRVWLEAEGYGVRIFDTGEACLKALSLTTPDVVCLALHLPGMGGEQILARVTEQYPSLAVVMLTGDSDVGTAVRAIKAGAFDYLIKPANRAKLVVTLRNAVARTRMSLRLRQLERAVGTSPYPGLIGESEVMLALFRRMDSVVLTDVTVLIHGESGTGKELVARGLHAASRRGDSPLVTLNCAAIPETLQESELFGHEKGAFTGATGMRPGMFEVAAGGTVFLDEVAELSPAAQAKLLRVVQEGTFQRVGGTRELRSDFRLMAATHRDLRRDVAAGRFREDLYYRLAVFELTVPPLRERGEDVVLLAAHFARAAGMRLIRRAVTLDPAVVEVVRAYHWPGNVRELDNAIQSAVVSCEGDVIRPRDLPLRVRGGDSRPVPAMAPKEAAVDAAAPGSEREGADGRSETTFTSLEQLERQAILDALHRAGGNRAEASRRLGIGRTTLYAKLRRYGLA